MFGPRQKSCNSEVQWSCNSHQSIAAKGCVRQSRIAFFALILTSAYCNSGDEKEKEWSVRQANCRGIELTLEEVQLHHVSAVPNRHGLDMWGLMRQLLC